MSDIYIKASDQAAFGYRSLQEPSFNPNIIALNNSFGTVNLVGIDPAPAGSVRTITNRGAYTVVLTANSTEVPAANSFLAAFTIPAYGSVRVVSTGIGYQPLSGDTAATGSQTPLAQNVDAAGFDITGAGKITATSVQTGYATTATAAGTTTLTAGSAQQQRFTGSTTQTVALPVVTTLSLGQIFAIVNDSTGLVTVNSSGGNAVVVVQPGTTAFLRCIKITADTTAAAWSVTYIGGGYQNIPSNSQSAAYTTVLADSGKSIDHPASDANARTFTIDSNANVAYPVGTAISFSNMTAEVVTIAITSDTMYLAGTGTTGSRSLARYGTATARKLTSTTWIISGIGLT